MPSLTVPLTPAPSTIYTGGYQPASTIRNTGLTTAYLSESPNVTPGNGFPLGPGSSIGWDKLRPLHAATAPGTVTTLYAFENSGNLFDAGAVADQLLVQGLPAAIAAQIAISGAPPTDINAILANVSQVVNPGVPWLIKLDNISQYQSLTVWVADEGNANKLRKVNVWWGHDNGAQLELYNDDGFVILDQGPSGVGYLGGFTTYRTPAKAADMWLNVGSNGFASNVHVVVIGSYKTMVSPIYACRAVQTYAAPPVGGIVYGSVQESALQLNLNPAVAMPGWWLSTRNGHGKILVDTQGAITYSLVLVHGISGQPLSASLQSSGPTQAMDVTFPNVPCQLYGTINSGAGWMRASIIFDPPG